MCYACVAHERHQHRSAAMTGMLAQVLLLGLAEAYCTVCITYSLLPCKRHVYVLQ